MQDRASADAVHHYGAKPDEARAIFGSLFRGAILKCPACGRGAMFRRVSGCVMPACATTHRDVERRRFLRTQERFSRLQTLQA